MKNNEQRTTNNEQRTTNNEQRTTNNEQRTKLKINFESASENEQVYITHVQLAKLCGFSVSTLYRKFKEYKIENDGKLISPKLRDEILIKLDIKKPEK